MLYVMGYGSACARHVVTCMYVRVHVHVSVVVDVLCCWATGKSSMVMDSSKQRHNL